MAPIRGKADMDPQARDPITVVVVREARTLFFGETVKGVENLVIPKPDAHSKARDSKAIARDADIGDIT